MSPQTVLHQLWAQGVRLKLSGDGSSLVAPAGSLSPEQRAVVLAHKPELVAFLTESRKTTARLLEAAMRACDHHGDGAQARADMRQQCHETPPHLQPDLLDHFNTTYGGKP